MDFEKLLEKWGDETTSEAVAAGREIRELFVDSIGFYEENRDVSDDDCRDLLNELEEDEFDLIHPVVVYPDEKNDRDFTLIAGERRLRAFRLGKQEKIVAIIRRDLTAKQIREKNIKENTQRRDEGLASLSRRYKKYCDDFNIKQKSAAKIFGVRESVFSDMVKYLWQVDQIPETKALIEEGVSDKWLLKELVRTYMKSDSAVRSIIAFGKSNNCFTREFVLAAVKMDLYGDIESEMRSWLAGGTLDNSEKTERGEKVDTPTIKKMVSTEEKIDEEQLPLHGMIADKKVDDESSFSNTDFSSDYSDDTEDDSDTEISTDHEVDEQAQAENEATDAKGSVRKRPVSKAEVLVEYEGQQYYLELGMVAEEEDRIVLRNLSGDIVLANPGEVKIRYVS